MPFYKTTIKAIEVEKYIGVHGPNNFNEKLLGRTAHVRL